MVEEYLTYNQAKEEIEFFKKKNTVILYIERITEKSNGDVIADIEGIADFSDATPLESYEGALLFLSEYGADENERFILTA